MYILIGVLVLVLVILGIGLFVEKRSSQTGKEELATPLCPKEITYQEVVYKVAEIGGQCWLAENLRAVNYRDGTPIPQLTSSAEWGEDEEGAFTCYYNQEQNCQDYGALYSWYAVDNEKGLCPEGWSVPTQEQWAELERAVCQELGYEDCQERFPDKESLGWRGTDEGQYLRSGDFRAVLGGFRNPAGPFSFLDERGFWWTANPSEDFAYARALDKDKEGIRRIESSKSSGFSVRCVND